MEEWVRRLQYAKTINPLLVSASTLFVFATGKDIYVYTNALFLSTIAIFVLLRVISVFARAKDGVLCIEFHNPKSFEGMLPYLVADF
jgi:hypothetical protein